MDSNDALKVTVTEEGKPARAQYEPSIDAQPCP